MKLKSIISEYGLNWCFNRGIYSLKLKLLSHFPKIETLFERKIPNIKSLDIFDVDVISIKHLLERLPEEKKKDIIDSAHDASIGKIRAFSSLPFDYGNPIDWQLNPITGKRCDENKKWYRISDFDKERGDIKNVWEISRFTHFLTFARAFLLTDDNCYYHAFSDQLNEWVKCNPYSFGANYKCGQEAAIRMVNLLLSYTVFKFCGLVSDRDIDNISNVVCGSYRKILSNFYYAHRCVRNNHTISELMGMLVGALCCSDSRRYKKIGILINEVINDQFTDDGGYIQLSFNYQRLALQDIGCILSVIDKAGISLSEISLSKILASAELMYQCQLDNGDVPNYGHNDGALIFPVTACGYRDYRSVINLIFMKILGIRRYALGDYDEELLWFGISGDKVSNQPVEEKARTGMQFQKAGLYTIRSNNDFILLVLNNYKNRPAHMDQLHLDFWHDGINVFCDSGSYSYADQIGLELSSAEGHNTVSCDDYPQMNRRGAFMIYDWTKSKLHQYSKDSFEGEYSSENGYRHVRTVSKIEGGYVIKDSVFAPSGTQVHVLFHTPCEIKKEGTCYKLEYEGREMCKLEYSGIISIVTMWRSLYYGIKESVNCINCLETATDGVAEFETRIIIGE